MSRASFFAIIGAALAVGTGLLFALDEGARSINENAAARAFILSDAFWPAVVGFILMMLAVMYGVTSSYRFHPARLSGRTGRERDA